MISYQNVFNKKFEKSENLLFQSCAKQNWEILKYREYKTQ